MPEENDDQLPVEIEAALELEPKPMKRGFASLRGVKRSTLYAPKFAEDSDAQP